MRLFPYAFIFAIGLFATACSENCNEVELSAEFSAAATAYGEAQAAYLQDDSEENCIELKNAIEAYLETNATLASCDGVISAGALGEAQVTQIEEQKDGLPCN